jgi:DNA-binding beta-propeller fold protein YncE
MQRCARRPQSGRLVITISAVALAAVVTLSPAAVQAGIVRPSNRERLARPAGVVVPWRERAPVLGPALTASFGFGSALVGSAPTPPSPNLVALDPATHTIYVANGYSDDTPNGVGDTVSVIDSRHCNTRDVSACAGPWPTITVGDGTPTDDPSGIAIDERTHTVYVSNAGANTVSVFNGATCNAEVTFGCAQFAANVPVGTSPVALYADPANHTVYVPNPGDTTVSMIDSATCNANDFAGCPVNPASVPAVDVAPASPNNVDVDPATHTVYVTTFGAALVDNGWAVFDANTCNAAVQTGCGELGRLQGAASGPGDAQVDTANDTLYTANFDNTVSAFDLSHCRATELAGCAAQTPGTVTPWPNPGFNENDVWVALDPALHTVYAVYARDDVLVAVDTDVCNGTHLSACARLTNPPTIHTGALPEMVALDGATQTLYVANFFDSDISVIDATRCNAQVTAGCRRRPPAVSISQPGGIAYDAATKTTYVTTGTNAVAMIDTRGCNAQRPAGCATAPRSVTVGEVPTAIAIDHRTHTVYVADYGTGSSGTVTVLDTSSCNATRSTGCVTVGTLQVPGGNPDDLAVDPLTGTLYVATIASSGANLISVFDAATCNARDATGCTKVPSTLQVGDSGDGFSALSLAVDYATNTVYATNLVTEPSDPSFFAGSIVYVMDGATCDATDRDGCDQTPATVTVPATVSSGSTPVGIAVDQATDTVYTADLDGGDVGTGTVGVINGATCNGQDTSGCDQTATVATAFGTEGVAIDPTTHKVYASNIEDSSVSVINGNTCNGEHTDGCGQTPAKVAVGEYPGAALEETNQSSNSSETIAVASGAGTAYIQNIDGVSVIPLAHH